MGATESMSCGRTMHSMHGARAHLWFTLNPVPTGNEVHETCTGLMFGTDFGGYNKGRACYTTTSGSLLQDMMSVATVGDLKGSDQFGRRWRQVSAERQPGSYELLLECPWGTMRSS